jgi:hypothetical protein
MGKPRMRWVEDVERDFREMKLEIWLQQAVSTRNMSAAGCKYKKYGCSRL